VKPLSESQLKAALLNKLRSRRRIGLKTIVANELPLGTTGVRADLALLGRRFIGIEVKSELDSLRRLRKQLTVYERYFDRTILLVAEKHLIRLKLEPDSRIEIWSCSSSGILSQITASPAKNNLTTTFLVSGFGYKTGTSEIRYFKKRRIGESGRLDGLSRRVYSSICSD